MAHVFKDRVRELVTATGGTGTFALSGSRAAGAYRLFSEVGLSNGDTVDYVAEAADGSAAEWGVGTYSAGVLTRSVAGSIAGGIVSGSAYAFPSGSRVYVGVVLTASRLAALQPLDATLTAFAALSIAADKLPYGTGADAFGLADLTSFGRTLIALANAPAGRTALGSTTVGDALFTAVNAAAGRTALSLGGLAVLSSVGTSEISADAVTYAKLQNISAQFRVLGRNSASAGDAEEVTLSQFLDWVGSAANGDILYRTGGAWARLGIGSTGDVLTVSAALPAWAANAGATYASQAEMEAASATNRAVSPGNIKWAPAVPKVLCYFDGAAGTPTPISSVNVSSITDNGTGSWTVNFTTSFSSSSYVAITGHENTGSFTARSEIGSGGKAAGSLGVLGEQGYSSTALDCKMHVACWGDQ